MLVPPQNDLSAVYGVIGTPMILYSLFGSRFWDEFGCAARRSEASSTSEIRSELFLKQWRS